MSAEEIKQLRITMGRTQRYMAALVGVSERTWQRWESGDAEPMSVFAEKLNEVKNYLGRVSA